MFDTTTDSCSSQQQLFTTRYSYGSCEQEFVFCCRGRPFAALVSPHLPTPTSSLLDFDLVKTLSLKMTDLQCKKFYFAGNKMRILGRVSTTVQCIQNGRTGSNFHIKGFVVTDLYKLLDTHCVAGNKMKQQIESLLDANDDDEDIDEFLNNERKCETAQMSAEKPDVSSLPQQAPGPQTGRRLSPASPSPRSGNPSSSSKEASSCSSAPTMPSYTFTPTTPASAIPFDHQAIRTAIPPGILPKPAGIFAIVDHDELGRWDALDYWKEKAEEKPFNTSLEDPRGHQARHVLLANIRRTAPDRVCSLCSYNLISNHNCSLPNRHTIAKHCVDCCKKGPKIENKKVKKKH